MKLSFDPLPEPPVIPGVEITYEFKGVSVRLGAKRKVVKRVGPRRKRRAFRTASSVRQRRARGAAGPATATLGFPDGASVQLPTPMACRGTVTTPAGACAGRRRVTRAVVNKVCMVTGATSGLGLATASHSGPTYHARQAGRAGALHRSDPAVRGGTGGARRRAAAAPAPIAQDGFGDARNSYAWSMAWFKGALYVGTARSAMCVENATIAYYLPDAGFYSREPMPGVTCPPSIHDADLRAEIWRYEPANGRWTRVYRSPRVPNPRARGRLVARDIGYRGMLVRTERGGRKALYVTTLSPASSSRS